MAVRALESTSCRALMSHEIQVLCRLSHILPILPWALHSKVFYRLVPATSTLNREQLFMPQPHTENLHGHSHPDPSAGLKVSLHFQLPFFSSQTHQCLLLPE